MKKWLKKYFIPHKENEHKPHILRLGAALFILTIVLLIEVYFLAQVLVLFPRVKFFATILENALIDGTNANRAQDKISLLKENVLLDASAQAKANDMVQKGYFAHVSPDGVDPWYWFKKAGYDYSYAGENLAVNFVDSEDVVNAWMNSPAHRENILSGNFTDIGIGIAKGMYDGKEAIFVVQMFGSLVKASAAVTSPVAVRPAAGPTTSSVAAVTGVKGAESVPVNDETGQNSAQYSVANNPSFLGQMIASPRALTNYLYLMLGTIILLALCLKIFIKMKIQHPQLIANGVLLLMIIASAMAFNYYLLLANAAIL